MKTFEEACEAVFCVPRKPGESEVTLDHLMDAQERYSAIICEVVNSRYVEMLISAFNGIHHRDKIPVETLLKNAFAQGVAVGMEMERVD